MLHTWTLFADIVLSHADDDDSFVSRLRRVLSNLPDLERGLTRILHKTASPAELLSCLQAFAGLTSGLGTQVGPSSSFLGGFGVGRSICMETPCMPVWRKYEPLLVSSFQAFLSFHAQAKTSLFSWSE